MSHVVEFNDLYVFQKFCGIHNRNLKTLEETLQVKLKIKGNSILIEGEGSKRSKAYKIINDIKEEIISTKRDVSHDVFKNIMEKNEAINSSKKVLYISSSGRTIIPKTENQEIVIKSLLKNDLVIITGPAGTGKTFLSVAVATYLLERGKISRIVLTRPAVEAGESLGFLPGDLYQKVEPYLKPLYDSLYYILGIDRVLKLIDKGVIEILPLAYMRGRTINDAFIILDEAQNTTTTQMKMFLTRLGEGSKMAITGDITQIDLKGKKSGIVEAMEILKDIKGISIIKLKKKDIVRHSLVQKIVEAYERFEQEKEDGKAT